MMGWSEIITLCASVAAILGAPIAFAVYLGNKIDGLRTQISEESKDFHTRLCLIEDRRKKK